MRRQLTLEQSSAVAAFLTLDPTENSKAAFLQALREISKVYPRFTVRDFSSVWNLRHPGFSWSKALRKEYNELVEPDPSKGFWGLKSPLEVAEILPEKEVLENLSRPWMKAALNSGMHTQIARNIKKNFPTESLEDIASEVSELMLTWGERGLCDEFLRNNKPPKLAVLAIWAEQKIRQRVYKNGTDALHRELRGLRTQTEIRKRKELSMEDLILEQGLKSDPNSPKAVWVLKDSQDPKLEIVAPEGILSEDLPPEALKKLDLVRAFIQVKRKRSPDRYARMFDHIKAGTPRAEVALMEGCSELTVSHLTNKVRGDIRESSKFLSVALLLLKKISEEPFSTLEEIQEENPSLESSNIEQAIQVLLEEHLIAEKKGRSFLATEAGRLLGEEA